MKQSNVVALIFLIFAAVFVAGQPAAAVPASGLHGQQVIATGPFDCDGTDYTAVWTNDTGGPLHVRQAQIWLGMYLGAQADFWVWLALDDGNVLGHSNWDHYADPTAPHMLHYTYAPDFILIQPGQELVLNYGCNQLGRDTAVGDTAVTLWWLAN